jgi:hypothetical protein
MVPLLPVMIDGSLRAFLVAMTKVLPATMHPITPGNNLEHEGRIISCED